MGKFQIACLVVLCFLFSTARAQNPPPPGPCASDCSSPFSPTIAYTVMIDAFCSVTLSCQQRYCGGVWELNVLSASMSGTCTNWKAGETIQRALGILVNHNMMNFPPQMSNDSATHKWRISRAACWQKNEGLLLTCSDECCVNYLNIKKKPDCVDFEVLGESSLSPKRACPPPALDEQNEEWVTPNCTDACGEFYPKLGERP